MQTILEKSRINHQVLKRTILKILSNDINNLSQPCFIPSHKKEYHTLLSAIGLTDKDIKDFAKRTFKGTIAQSFNIANEPGTNLLLFIMWWALNNKDESLFYSSLVYHMVRQYGHVMNRHFKQFCNPEVFSYSLETITKTHLFHREKTVANSLFHLARELQKKYSDDLKTFNIDGIIQFISASRHRISQSVKSFAEHYYRAWKSGDALKVSQDADDEGNAYQSQVLERGKQLIDSAVKKITVYKTIDNKAFNDAVTLTKSKIDICKLIVNELKDIKYSDNIRLILQLFIKEITNKSMLCGRSYQDYIKKLMTLKRTKSKIYFKQQINILLLNVLKNIDFLKTFNSYSIQVQYAINIFLSLYLTMTMRNMVC